MKKKHCKINEFYCEIFPICTIIRFSLVQCKAYALFVHEYANQLPDVIEKGQIRSLPWLSRPGAEKMNTKQRYSKA